jgi:hypothetical protein
MAAADEFRNDFAALFVRLEDARGCVHVTEDGAMFTHDAAMGENEICVEAPDFADALGELKWLTGETAARIEALTDAVEQLHRTAHGTDASLLLCPHAPCRELRRHLPNARGVVPA